jgi:NADP-dependent 3-hydroxy acid dehydrogenase YdfG
MTAYKRIGIITGVSSGIGEAVLRKLIKNGYGILGVARNEEKLNKLKSELGTAFYPLCWDITDEETQDKLFDLAEEYFGDKVSLLLCNAGRGLGGAVSTADLSEFEAMIKLNLTSTLRLMQKSAQYLINRLNSHPFPEYSADIVVIGSVVGRNVSPFSAVYGSSKFAIHSLTEGLRRELGPKGIRVSLIEPAFVISGFQKVAGYSEEMVNGITEKYGPLFISPI